MTSDETAFTAAAERHRRELSVHCYRMLASFDDAEDAVQETLLRAWRAWASFDHGTLLRAWLYRIATNVCLDILRAKARRPVAALSFAEVPWLTPYPDLLLDDSPEPDVAAVERETIELAFLAALQVLPPRQRAAFIARDVLGWPAADTAALLETSVAAANSALQRARVTMQEHLPARRADWSAEPASAEEQALLAQFIDAHERSDSAAAMAIVARDIRVTMPPHPYVFDGIDVLASLQAQAASMGDWRLVPTRANRLPTAASYLRRPGDSMYRPFKFDVLRMHAGRIAEVTTFGTALFPVFDLPATL